MIDRRLTPGFSRDRGRCRGYGRGEPPVSELLEDPIMQLVMARDRVNRDDVDRLMSTVRRCVNARRTALGA